MCVQQEDSDAAPAVAVAVAAVPVPVGKPKRTCKAPNCNRLDKGRGFCKRVRPLIESQRAAVQWKQKRA